jgi:hypothetical protein
VTPRPIEPLHFLLKVCRLDQHAEKEAGDAADEIVPEITDFVRGVFEMEIEV